MKISFDKIRTFLGGEGLSVVACVGTAARVSSESVGKHEKPLVGTVISKALTVEIVESGYCEGSCVFRPYGR